MSGCNNCFTNCTQIVSDKCVKYTGDSLFSLYISSGDPLSTVIEKLTDYLLTVMTGEGISPTIPAEYICTLIDGYLPASPTLVDIIVALVRVSCDLQSQIDDVVADIDTIEANYTIGCLTGVTAGSGTHDILQAVIAKVCSMSLSISALQTALSHYVELDDLDSLIEQYLTAHVSSKQYLKMVPYEVTMLYTDLSNFGPTGEGIGDWEQIYLCDGRNNTPDMRGRVPVGCNTMSCSPYGDVNTDPAFPANPNYSLGMVQGENKVTLGINNLASHSHTASSPVVDPGHRHVFVCDNQQAVAGSYEKKDENPYGNIIIDADDGTCWNVYTKSDLGINSKSAQTTGITVSTTIGNTGGSIAHNNIQPVRALHFIIYIPD